MTISSFVAISQYSFQHILQFFVPLYEKTMKAIKFIFIKVLLNPNKKGALELFF